MAERGKGDEEFISDRGINVFIFKTFIPAYLFHLLPLSPLILLGVNEKAIIEILSSRSGEQRMAINKFYQETYQKVPQCAVWICMHILV